MTRQYLVLCFAVVIAGCENMGMSDLETLVVQGNRLQSKAVLSPPEMQIYPAVAFHNPPRDPFLSKIGIADEPLDQAKPGESSAILIAPRVRTLLEQVDVSELKMKGVFIDSNGAVSALVINKGTIFRVHVGDYIGRREGFIKKITEEGIYYEEVRFKNSAGKIEKEQMVLPITQSNK